MTWFEALLIGFVQGISEFLPISSTALMLIVQRLLHISIGEDFKLAFETFLHIASVLAVIVYFRYDLKQISSDFLSHLKTKQPSTQTNFRFTVLIIISTLITIFTVTVLEFYVGDNLTNPSTVGLFLVITGLSLIVMEHGLSHGIRSLPHLRWSDSVIIGLAQAISLIPGMSRTGSTLFVALLLGLDKKTSLRYSIILSIPVFLGMSLLKLPDLIRSYNETQLLALTTAFTTSFLFALVGIRWIISLVENTKLSYFACFCIALGFLSWGWL
ncbi:undecaprenyl-diphosphate phosphatase [Halalkalibacter akibai]|uniref:Undecaprenyl-diphosphatase n=1 Tax=Halalkalibacter akibai (strain ATCC 43226 / DSM 21942 / CIP 109018 / JCM 9157 / 1139) TaxID=1236973 RepID=W4QNI6_HALA3|nr:undecaprenyl-diphosphate phosphatase [Halalkalibacter akibai]GAE33442.1 undecaprenyl-diphosphatase [Halalkalibacter akibai JCM 9157]